jgi:hypothetical protein
MYISSTFNKISYKNKLGFNEIQKQQWKISDVAGTISDHLNFKSNYDTIEGTLTFYYITASHLKSGIGHPISSVVKIVIHNVELNC